ncbi:MAG: hypothetical protein AVDCRST_MAG67-1370, partial [uncultured Solirubrobacteraceae bacterium]
WRPRTPIRPSTASRRTCATPTRRSRWSPTASRLTTTRPPDRG